MNTAYFKRRKQTTGNVFESEIANDLKIARVISVSIRSALPFEKIDEILERIDATNDLASLIWNRRTT